MSEEAKKVNEITATKKINDVEKTATITFDFGGDLETAVELFGKDVVYTNFTRSAVITAQAAMRRMLEDGLDNEAIISKMSMWKPGVALERIVDPIGATLSKFANMSADEQDALLEKLKAAKK